MLRVKDEFEEEFQQLKIDEPYASYAVFDGNSKVLISCPHAVSQLRNGRLKGAEPETAIIALYLNRTYDIPCIIKLHNHGDDANFDTHNDYKVKLRQYIKKNNIKFVIDLHSMGSFRTQNICIGTGGTNNKNLLNLAKYTGNIYNCFKNFDHVYINNPFKAKSKNVNARYISQNMKVPSIQLEINNKVTLNYYNQTEDNWLNLVDDINNLIKFIEDKIKD